MNKYEYIFEQLKINIGKEMFPNLSYKNVQCFCRTECRWEIVHNFGATNENCLRTMLCSASRVGSTDEHRPTLSN